MDNVNFPPKVRLGVYIFNGLGSIVVAYLAAKHLIGQPELVAWASYNLFTSTLAGFNVKVKK